MTRAERKAINRQEADRLFATLTARTRRANYDLAVADLRASRQDDRLARELNIGCGPGCAAMFTAFHRANITDGNVTCPGCAPDSCEAFLAIGRAALIRWHKQAAAIERAMASGRLQWHRDTLQLYSVARNGTVWQFRSNLYALTQLCAIIQANAGKPRSLRLTFEGNVNRQVEQSVFMRVPNGTFPVAHATTFIPWVRSKIRQYHGEKDAPTVRLCPAYTFQAALAPERIASNLASQRLSDAAIKS
jgi:hypothetical protein